jgi:hypothetical protein
MFEQLLVERQNPVVTVEQLAAFSRFDVPTQYDTSSPPQITADYQLILTMIEAASDAVSQMAALSCCQETWLWTLDFFPGTQDPRVLYNYQLAWGYNWIPFWWGGFPVTDSIEFIRRPLMVGGSPPLDPVVNYDDPFGNSQVLDPTTYTVRANKITLLPGNYWPATSRLEDCIQIQYTAGYSVDASLVPNRLEMAVMFLAGWWFENRLAVGTEPTTAVKHTLESLIQPFKMLRIPR